jgi:hypothetical protein
VKVAVVVWAGEPESVAVTVYVVDEESPVGVPEITPVVGSSERPAGRVGAIEYVIGAVPPAMLIGLSGVISVPIVAEIFPVFVEDVSGAISVKTANEKDALALSPIESVIETVKVAAPVIVVGVPEMSPVFESKVIPAGRVGAIVNTEPPEPPRAETGVKEAA